MHHALDQILAIVFQFAAILLPMRKRNCVIEKVLKSVRSYRLFGTHEILEIVFKGQSDRRKLVLRRVKDLQEIAVANIAAYACVSHDLG